MIAQDDVAQAVRRKWLTTPQLKGEIPEGPVWGRNPEGPPPFAKLEITGRAVETRTHQWTIRPLLVLLHVWSDSKEQAARLMGVVETAAWWQSLVVQTGYHIGSEPQEEETQLVQDDEQRQGMDLWKATVGFQVLLQRPHPG